MKKLIFAVALAAGLGCVASATAQVYPSRPITIIVPLPPGEHAFMYVVDGAQWMSPPLASDYVDDGFGAKNGVVVVKP